jgi:hypothetical protein
LAVNGFGFFLNAVPALGMPLLLVHHLHAGADAYGAVLAASGAGALLGNAVAARNRQSGAFVTRFCLAWAVAGLLLAATGMAPGLGWILAFSAGSGVVTPIIGIALRARLSLFPKPERLRLMSINFTVIRGTIGMAVIPASIADTPEQGFIIAGCALAVVATVAALLGRRSARPTIGAVGRVGAPVVRPSCATRPITRCGDRWSSEARQDQKDGAVVGADRDDSALWGRRGTIGRAFHGRVMSMPRTHNSCG